MTATSNDAALLPHWDLSNVYPGLESEAFLGAVGELDAFLNDLSDYLDAHQIHSEPAPSTDADALTSLLDGYLDRLNSTLRLFRTLQAYVYAHVTTDSYNTTAQRLLSELEIMGVRLREQTVRFQVWIGSIAERLPQLLERDGVARDHAFYVTELADQSQYLMSETEESLATELSLSGANSWAKLQGTICSQLIVSFPGAAGMSRSEAQPQREQMPIATLQNLRYHNDGEIRRQAFEVEIAAWRSVQQPLAAALNGVKGAVGILDRRRGRSDALHASLDQSRIDRDTLETMLAVMHASFPVFRRYLKAKAARLGKQALPWWDLFAPVGQTERRFTFPEAQEFIVEQFGTFSDRLAQFARRAFGSRWIDAEPRAGKRGGAFCLAIPGVEESRILCNFDGSLDQVFTLAHELGHAYHNECRVGKTTLQRITPMTLAETASIFCENIVTDAVLASAASESEELAVLETFMIGATQIIVDIYSRYLFEKEVFERRAKAELSADDFCEVMLRAQRATYGDGLDERHLHPYMWAWKGHYYRPTLSFYNYPYAFGLLFGLGLYAIYQERGAAFLSEYDGLLSSTGEATATDLAARFDIDIRRPEFWRSSLKAIEVRVERYEALG
jgi:pepF/M3 family oligoendopeptidase